jgi:hypothetical protein
MIDGTLRNATLEAMQNYTKSNETRDEVDWFQSQVGAFIVCYVRPTLAFAVALLWQYQLQ